MTTKSKWEARKLGVNVCWRGAEIGSIAGTYKNNFKKQIEIADDDDDEEKEKSVLQKWNEVLIMTKWLFVSYHEIWLFRFHCNLVYSVHEIFLGTVLSVSCFFRNFDTVNVDHFYEIHKISHSFVCIHHPTCVRVTTAHHNIQ